MIHRISFLIRRDTGAPSLSVHSEERLHKGYCLQARKRGFIRNRALLDPDLGLAASGTVRNKFLLFEPLPPPCPPICGIWLQQPERTKIIRKLEQLEKEQNIIIISKVAENILWGKHKRAKPRPSSSEHHQRGPSPPNLPRTKRYLLMTPFQ